MSLPFLFSSLLLPKGIEAETDEAYASSVARPLAGAGLMRQARGGETGPGRRDAQCRG